MPGSRLCSLERKPGLLRLFYGSEEALNALSERLASVFEDVETEGGLSLDVRRKLVGGSGGSQVLWTLGLLAFIIFTGLAVERLFLAASGRMRSQMIDAALPGRLQIFGIIFSRLILDVTGIFVHMAVTFLLYFSVFGRESISTIVSSSIIVSYYFRLVLLAARYITSPDDPRSRPMPVSDADARFLHHWLVLISTSILPSATASLALAQAGANRELILLTCSTAGPTVSLLLVVMIFRSRKRVAHAICPSKGAAQTFSFFLAERCAAKGDLLGELSGFLPNDEQRYSRVSGNVGGRTSSNGMAGKLGTGPSTACPLPIGPKSNIFSALIPVDWTSCFLSPILFGEKRLESVSTGVSSGCCAGAMCRESLTIMLA